MLKSSATALDGPTRMQGTLVRLLVVVAGLLLPKEHTPVLEHDDGIVTGMRRHEGLLQRHRARLDRELAKDAMPKDHPEGRESHSVLQPGVRDSEQIEVSEPEEPEQQLRESSMNESHSTEGQTEINTSEPPDLEYPQTEDAVHLDKDEEPSDLSEELSSQQEVLPEHSQSLPPEELAPETANGQLAEDGTDVPESILSENIVTHEVETETQPSLSDFSDLKGSSDGLEDESAFLNDKKLSPTEKHIDLGMGSQTIQKQKPQTSTEGEYMWYLCNAYSLFTLIRFLLRHLRGNSPDQEMPETSQHDRQAPVPSVSAEISVPDQETLMSFYDRYVHVPTHESQRVCEFVEGFVDDLLIAIRETSSKDDRADVEVEDFLDVGSLYEAWCTGRTLTCDLWVPISLREPYSLQAQLSTNHDEDTGSDVQGYGRVKVLKGGGSSANGCPCSQASEDSDMLCLLHTNDKKEEKRDEVTDAIDGPLCCENTPYLSRTDVARWFCSAAHKAWQQMSHKYELELKFWSRESPFTWHVRFRSGRTIHFNVTPVVMFKDTDVCLVSCLAPKKRKNDDDDVTLEAQEQWPLSFARYERNLLRLLGRHLPQNSCHLRCLQILSFLNQKQVGLTGESGLSSHHLKTAMLHLLLDKALLSSEWGAECLADRSRDALGLLKKSLQTRWLSHALVGNPLIPQELGLPANVCHSKPINILQPLLNQGRLYIRTVQHFDEMLRNMPVLIQEYMKILKLD